MGVFFTVLTTLADAAFISHVGTITPMGGLVESIESGTGVFSDRSARANNKQHESAESIELERANLPTRVN